MSHKGEVKFSFDYTNYAGKDSRRLVIPYGFQYRTSKPWYPEPTWLMRAYDLDKRDFRDFKVSNMRNIEELPL